MMKRNSKKQGSLLRKKNEEFEGFRNIESVEDILDLLSPDTRQKFQSLDNRTQDYYLNKLSQQVDWDTEEAKVIEDTLVDIMRFESFGRRRNTLKIESKVDARVLVYDAVDNGLITAIDILPLLNQHQLEGLVADFDLDYLGESCKRESRARFRRHY